MVEVRKTGVSTRPHSAADRNPVHSPAPFSTAPPAGTGSRNRFPPGSITVTPVLATPRPAGGGSSSRQTVACPTPTPGTSVIDAVGPAGSRPMVMPRSAVRAIPHPRRRGQGDHGPMTGLELFGGLFGRGGADAGDRAWLQAMLDAEAALARAAERAGLAPPGSGAAVTAVARAELFDGAALARQAAQAGNPVPALVRALTAALPAEAAGAAQAVHAGATSQDIIDTAAMLVAARSTGAILSDLATAAGHAARLAGEHAGTVMAGRTLLQQAVPVT